MELVCHKLGKIIYYFLLLENIYKLFIMHTLCHIKMQKHNIVGRFQEARERGKEGLEEKKS